MRIHSILMAGLIATCIAACDNNSGRQETAATTEEVRDESNKNNYWNAEEEAAFLKEAWQTDLTIVAYSEFAYRKANTLALRDFANQSVSYYKNLNAQIEKMGNKYSGDGEYGAEKEWGEGLEDLRNKEGKEFEQDYLNKLKALLEKQTDLFEDAAEKSPEEQIRNRAAKVAANLKAHFAAVEELQEDI